MNKTPRTPKKNAYPLFIWPITRERYRQVLIKMRAQYKEILELKNELELSRSHYNALSAAYEHEQLLKERVAK